MELWWWWWWQCWRRLLQNNRIAAMDIYIIVKNYTLRQFASTRYSGDMSWSCPVGQKDFSREDTTQRHMSSKHLVHPFTCMIAGMTGSGKTLWVKSLLQQAQKAIHLPPERIVWCYSQWQPAYSEIIDDYTRK